MSLKLNKFLFFKNKNKIIKLNHDEIVVAIGIIINPKLENKLTLIETFIATITIEI